MPADRLGPERPAATTATGGRAAAQAQEPAAIVPGRQWTLEELRTAARLAFTVDGAQHLDPGAIAASVQVSTRQVQRWLSGQARPSPDSAHRLRAALLPRTEVLQRQLDDARNARASLAEVTEHRRHHPPTPTEADAAAQESMSSRMRTWNRRGFLEPHLVLVVTHPDLGVTRTGVIRHDGARLQALLNARPRPAASAGGRWQVQDALRTSNRFEAVLVRHALMLDMAWWRVFVNPQLMPKGHSDGWLSSAPLPDLSATARTAGVHGRRENPAALQLPAQVTSPQLPLGDEPLPAADSSAPASSEPVEERTPGARQTPVEDLSSVVEQVPAPRSGRAASGSHDGSAPRSPATGRTEATGRAGGQATAARATTTGANARDLRAVLGVLAVGVGAPGSRGGVHLQADTDSLQLSAHDHDVDAHVSLTLQQPHTSPLVAVVDVQELQTATSRLVSALARAASHPPRARGAAGADRPGMPLDVGLVEGEVVLGTGRGGSRREQVITPVAGPARTQREDGLTEVFSLPAGELAAHARALAATSTYLRAGVEATVSPAPWHCVNIDLPAEGVVHLSSTDGTRLSDWATTATWARPSTHVLVPADALAAATRALAGLDPAALVTLAVAADRVRLRMLPNSSSGTISCTVTIACTPTRGYPPVRSAPAAAATHTQPSLTSHAFVLSRTQVVRLVRAARRQVEHDGSDAVVQLCHEAGRVIDIRDRAGSSLMRLVLNGHPPQNGSDVADAAADATGPTSNLPVHVDPHRRHLRAGARPDVTSWEISFRALDLTHALTTSPAGYVVSGPSSSTLQRNGFGWWTFSPDPTAPHRTSGTLSVAVAPTRDALDTA